MWPSQIVPNYPGGPLARGAGEGGGGGLGLEGPGQAVSATQLARSWSGPIVSERRPRGQVAWELESSEFESRLRSTPQTCLVDTSLPS